MRIVPLAMGVLLLLAGIVLEGMYFASSKSPALEANAFLVTGIVSIALSFLFLLMSARIPKLQTFKP